MNQIPNKLTPQTKLTRKQRVGLLIVAVVVLLGLLTATVFRSNLTSFFRWIAYSQSDSSFSHNAQASSLFLGMGDDLLIGTQSQIQVVSPTGTVKLKQSVTMSSPALNASGDYAVVYDVGGRELKVVKGETLLHELTLPEEESLLCATINEKGWVAVTSKASGYKGVVTVYNRDFESVLTIRLSSRYISDAVVTPDSRGVYLVSPGQADGAFENTLLYYTISSREEPTRTISLGSNVVLSIRSAGRCWILGDKSVMILDSSGVITASYDYKGQYLKMGSLQGDGYAALYLSPSSSGSTGTLVTVGSDGRAYGALELDGQTLAMAAQGKTIAVLTTNSIYTTDRNLTSYTTSPNQRGIRNLAVYADGSVALVNSAAVSLYFPSTGTTTDAQTTEDTTQAATQTDPNTVSDSTDAAAGAGDGTDNAASADTAQTGDAAAQGGD
jgi:hypothetical protein